MSLSRTDENELLTALHSGVVQDAPWRLFLQRLRARTDADLCRLVIRAAGSPQWAEADAVRARDGADFVAPDFEMLRPGRVYADAELEESGDERGRHIRLAWPEGGTLVLSLYRRREDFRARDAALLSALAPHLVIALRTQQEIEGARRRNRMAETVLADFMMAWIVLDARGRVLDCDPVGARLIEEGRMIRRAADGRLRCRLPEAEALLEKAVAGPVCEPSAAWLDIDRPTQMVIAPPPACEGAILAPPHCLLLIRGQRQAALHGGRHLPALFRLTRSEAALAARIAEGETLADAAVGMGLTIETARNYSKRIFLKTSARGQADLVRILLTGVAMLG